MNNISKKLQFVKSIPIFVIKNSQVVRRDELEPFKALPQKKKTQKKEKGFQQAIYLQKEVSKQKIKKNSQGQNSASHLVRKNPNKGKTLQEKYVRKILTTLKTEIFERFEYYLKKDKA